MKIIKILIVSLVIFSIGFAISSYGQKDMDERSEEISELWAPLVDFDFNAKYNMPGMNEMLMNSLPKKGEIPYPAYPGARVVSAMKFENENQIEMHQIWLLAKNTPEEVFAFYRKKLEDWSIHDSSIPYRLWQGSPEQSQDAFMFLISSIIIHEPLDIFHHFEYMPKAQTAFIVNYIPNQ